jgi:hypothetical protein
MLTMTGTSATISIFNLKDALSNNLPLSDEHELEVGRTLKHADKELTLLNEEITRFEAMLLDLHARRVHGLSQIHLHRIVVSPLRKLPNAVLAEIFMHCVPDGVDLPVERFSAPWILGQVCSRWRQVALGTPFLWNNLRLQYGNWSNDTGLSHLAKHYLARSGMMPITLEIRGDDIGYVQSVSDPIFDIVIPYARRLQKISIDCHPVWLKPFFELPAGVLNRLETMVLRVFGDRHIPDVVTVFDKAPRLSQVTLMFNASLTSYRLPWTRLTDLHLPCAMINPDLALVLLRYCTRLLNCSIQLGPGDAASQTLPTILPLVTLDKIRSFVVNIEHCAHFSQFLRRLVLPNLVTFELVSVNRAHGWEPAFVPLLTHSRLLQSLSVSLVVLVPSIELLLKDSPRLVSLDLKRGQAFSSTTLDRMSTGAWVPTLATLACVVDELKPFLSMLEGRLSSQTNGAGACTTMHTINITMPNGPIRSWYGLVHDFQSLDRVAKLRSAGWNIILSAPDSEE